MFAPEQSIVKMMFQSEIPAWLTVSPPVASEWDACLQTLEGHSSTIYSVAFSHDSKVLASSSWDQTIKIWDVVTGICISTLKGSDSAVYTVAFSHDSKILASTSDNEIRVWDVVTGTCNLILKGHSKYVKCTAFSQNSRMLASASKDCTIKLWDLTSGKCTSTLNGHSEGVCSVAFSHDFTILVSISHDSSIKLWDAATGDCKATIKVINDSVQSVAFSHDSRIFALVSDLDDKCIKLWNTDNGEYIAMLNGHSKTVYKLCFSHDSKMLASASTERDIRLWDIATSKCIATLKCHSHETDSLHFSHDSKLLVSSSYYGTIKIWDLEADIDQIPLPTVNGDIIYGIKPVKRTKTLISGSSDEIIQLWDVPTASRTATLNTGCGAWPYPIAVAHNAKLLATTSIANGQVQLWNIATGVNIATIEGDNSSILSTEPWRDIDSMPSIIENNGLRYIKVWQPGEEKFTQYGKYYSIISAVTFSHDSQLLASASAADGTIKVWGIVSNACVATLAGHSSWVSQLFFLPQSDIIVSSSGDRTVKIWDIRTAICTATLEGQSKPDYKSIAFSHDYNMLASGMDDGSIQIWNIATGERQMKFPGPSQTPVAFSHNSALLASIAWRPRDEADMDNSQRTLNFWNVSTGLCIATIDIPSFVLHYISFDEAELNLSTSFGNFLLKGTCFSGLVRKHG